MTYIVSTNFFIKVLFKYKTKFPFRQYDMIGKLNREYIFRIRGEQVST